MSVTVDSFYISEKLITNEKEKMLMNIEGSETDTRKLIEYQESASRGSFINSFVATLTASSRFGKSKEAVNTWKVKGKVEALVKKREEEQAMLCYDSTFTSLQLEDMGNSPSSSRMTAAALFKFKQYFGVRQLGKSHPALASSNAKKDTEKESEVPQLLVQQPTQIVSSSDAETQCDILPAGKPEASPSRVVGSSSTTIDPSPTVAAPPKHEPVVHSSAAPSPPELTDDYSSSNTKRHSPDHERLIPFNAMSSSEPQSTERNGRPESPLKAMFGPPAAKTGGASPVYHAESREPSVSGSQASRTASPTAVARKVAALKDPMAARQMSDLHQKQCLLVGFQETSQRQTVANQEKLGFESLLNFKREIIRAQHNSFSYSKPFGTPAGRTGSFPRNGTPTRNTASIIPASASAGRTSASSPFVHHTSGARRSSPAPGTNSPSLYRSPVRVRQSVQPKSSINSRTML